MGGETTKRIHKLISLVLETDPLFLNQAGAQLSSQTRAALSDDSQWNARGFKGSSVGRESEVEPLSVTSAGARRLNKYFRRLVLLSIKKSVRKNLCHSAVLAARAMIL